MKITKVLAAGAMLLAIVGCKSVDIKDGKIPDNYLAQAKKIEGVYSGKFNGINGELVVRIEGNKPILTYRSSQGSNDILNNNCHSSFGNLTKVYVKGNSDNYSISAVNFNFNPGNCSLNIAAREVTIDLKETDRGMKLNMTMLKEVQSRQECKWDSGVPPHVPPQQICRWEQTPYYLYGTFSR